MKSAIVLITLATNHTWVRHLAGTLRPIGKLDVIKLSHVSADKLTGCKLVLLDVSAVKTMSALVKQLTTTEPPCRVIVMTASPNWRGARAAFEAGALDYLSKGLSADAILTAIQAALKKPPLRAAVSGGNHE